MKKNKKWLVVFGLVATSIVIIMFVIRPAENNTGKNKLTIEVYPKDTLIKIDGKEFKSPVDVYLVPGKYTIEYSRFGFRDVSFVLDINRNKKMFDVLDPVTDEAREWQAKNQHLYNKEAEYAQREASDDAQKIIEQNPIVKGLPKTTSAFTVGMGPTQGDGKVLIVINSDPENQFKAVSYLKQLNIDLSPYYYESVNPNTNSLELNPFETESGSLYE